MKRYGDSCVWHLKPLNMQTAPTCHSLVQSPWCFYWFRRPSHLQELKTISGTHPALLLESCVWVRRRRASVFTSTCLKCCCASDDEKRFQPVWGRSPEREELDSAPVKAVRPTINHPSVHQQTRTRKHREALTLLLTDKQKATERIEVWRQLLKCNSLIETLSGRNVRSCYTSEPTENDRVVTKISKDFA